MQQRRLFTTVTTADAQRAFETGVFTPAIITYLQKNNAATVVAGLRQNVKEITLTAEILALPDGKQCGIFISLPAHIEKVTFNFENLKEFQVKAAATLLSHAPYAQNVTRFELTGLKDESTANYLADVFKKFMKVDIERCDSKSPACR